MGDECSGSDDEEVHGDGIGLFLNGYAYHKHNENKRNGTL